MAEQTKTGFRPVQGAEESILAANYNEGWVYFATDSGKIFLDAEGENKIVMGGSGSSLFYAHATSVRENAEGTYTLPYNSLDDESAKPKEDDLIININGGFYRVLDANEDDGIECTLLAVSGSGSGGGGGESGGGTGGGSSATMMLELVDASFPTTFVYQQDSFVTFKATATMDTLISYTVKVTGSSTATYSYAAYSGEEFSINIGQLLFSGTNKITVTATGENSGNATKSYSSRTSIILSLQENANFNPLQVFDGACTFSCIPVGSGLEKTLRAYVDGVLAASAIIPGTISNRTYTMDIPEQPHGSHDVEVILATTVNGIEMKTESLKYELAWREPGVTSPIIWIPKGYINHIVNYTDATVNYMVYNPVADTSEVRFYRESIELATSPQNLTYSSTAYLKWDITDYEVGSNSYTISVGSTSKNFSLTVEEDTSRDMNILTSGLVLNLDATGRSNNENETSRQIWEHKNINNLTTSVKFKDFNWYNNGWFTDDNGKTCLRISNGASISVPMAPLNILNSTALPSSLAFEFRFKVRNVNEYATLVQRVSDADSTNTVSGYETIKGVFGKFYSTLGLCLGTQEAFFKASNVGVSARYREDEIVNVTFVLENRTTQNPNPLLYIYLNGVMSGITTYTPSESFESNASELVFNSDYCDVDLYKVRVYKSNLSSADVVHNYIADLKDVVEYDMNDIVSYDTQSLPVLNYDLMREYNIAHPESPMMPYVVMKTFDADDMMPYVKGGKKKLSMVKFVNPMLDYLYENEMIDGTTYLQSCPSFEAVAESKAIIDVQGTSSQGYPKRNYKIKLKDCDTWIYTNGPLVGQSLKDEIEYEGFTYKLWYMDNTVGESTFTWKADYMDSSRVHNTGLASYISSLYSKHPLKDYGVSGSDNKRTTIYGFPMIAFQEKQDGTTEFMGMYNYNLDKGCKDTYGFTDGSPSKIPSYSEIAPEDEWVAKEAYEETETGYALTTDTVRDTEKVYYTKGYKTFKKASECWEFSNNQGTYCSFQTNAFDVTNDTYVETPLSALSYVAGKYYIMNEGSYVLESEDSEYSATTTYYIKTVGPLEVSNHFEYRYHADADDIDDCIDGAGDFASLTQEERNAYMLKKYKNLQSLATWLLSTKDDLEKFRNEFSKHFDEEYCYVYFIMTELLHMYDSRGKNLMLATWGPKVEGGTYIWYPIFYDMDTQLGINNSGVPTWDYYAEPTDGNMFSTSNSILWNNLWACFQDQIKAKYILMRKANLDILHLDGYYRSDPTVSGSYAMMGRRPLVLNNLDEYYKYITPTTKGFINTSGELTYDTGSFYYCLQGTRDLMRYLYLRNRINYLDSKWAGGSYATEAAKQEFWARIDGNNGASTSDHYLFDRTGVHAPGSSMIDDGVTYEYTDGEHPLDSTPLFKITPFLKQYVRGIYDDSQMPPNFSDGTSIVTVSPNEDVIVKYENTPALTQQLVYIGGGEYIKDLGELGLNYIDELHIPTLKRLERLSLGSDAEGYYNSQMNSTNLSLAANAKNADGTENKNAKSLLKQVVLTGLNALDGTIDISGSEKLEEFRALNTQISAVEFADGVQLKTLHLPKTITTLTLTEPTALVSTAKTAKTGNAISTGLFFEGLTDKVGETIADGTETKLSVLSIIGGNMGYGSYKLLETLVNIKKKMQESASVSDGYSKQVNINLEKVDWSPYEVVEFGEPYNASITYYCDNERYALIEYTYSNAEQWSNDTLNGRVFTYNPQELAKEYATVSDLSMFDTFISSYENAMIEFDRTGSKELNYFRNTSNTATKPTLPNITGSIFVNNTSGMAYKEADIQNKYLKYFPDLKIFCKDIEEGFLATFVSISNGKEEVIEVQRYAKDDESAHPVLPEQDPVKLNYTFLGWSLKDNGAILTNEEIEELVFSDEITSYKFYAIYKVTEYKITFCNTSDKEVLYETKVNFGEYLTNPSLLPSTDEASLGATSRYRFAGWVTDYVNCFQKSAQSAANVVVDITKVMSQNMDRTFYACYYVEDCTMVATDDKYFDFTAAPWQDELDSQYNLTGYVISPADGYKLSGKITLPVMHNGQPIVAIGGFQSQENITHIYWLGTSSCRRIDSSCFAGCFNLKHFEFPPQVRAILNYAFQSCSSLEPFNFENNNTLYHLGQGAFNAAFSTTAPLEKFVIPGSVTTIGGSCLSYNNGVTGGFTELQIGSVGHPTQLTKIGTTAVIQNASTTVKHLSVYVVDNSNIPEELDKAINPHSAGYNGNIAYSGTFDFITA